MRTRAFSLAELMISLAVLGIGLLFIAAALPVGIDYARQATDVSNADAAVEEAFDALQMSVRTSNDIAFRETQPNGTRVALWRLDNLFRPRTGTDPLMDPRLPPPTSPAIRLAPEGPVDPTDLDRPPYEPLVKVRAFSLQNILHRTQRPTIDDGERLVNTFLATEMSVAVNANHLEADFAGTQGASPFSLAADPANNAFYPNSFFPAPARFFPAISSDERSRPRDFFNNWPNDAYIEQPMRWPGGQANYDRGSETTKTLERRIAWTAFYRRVSYAAYSDPLQYEYVVVATRRPSATHRFAVQDPTQTDFSMPRALGTNDDRIAPVPWLVSFTQLPPALTGGGTDYAINPRPFPAWPELVASPAFSSSALAELSFGCTREVAKLLAPESILIPARNDMAPHAIAGRIARCTFVPSIPDSLPLFRVTAVEPPSTTAFWTVKVAYDGAYPHLVGVTPDKFPFWVVPPSYTERDTSGQPVFDKRNPIASISRRIVRVPEMTE